MQVFAANRRSGKQATTSLRTPSSLPWSAPAATTLVRISTSLPAASAPAARPLAIERAGPSRWRWWARSRSRQGASLALGPRPWRGFGLDGSLDQAKDRQLRDGRERSGPRVDICRITPTTLVDDYLSPISFRSCFNAITRCRELLGDEARELSDEDVDTIRRHAHVMAHLLGEIFQQQHMDRETHR